MEERFRKAMIANAQLDNDRASQTYQIQLLKDKLEDMEESYSQLQRECKEKTRDCNALKRSLDKLNEELKLVQGQLNERDTLITEQGLVIVAIENEDGTDAKRALVSVENAQLLGSVQGSLGRLEVFRRSIYCRRNKRFQFLVIFQMFDLRNSAKKNNSCKLKSSSCKNNWKRIKVRARDEEKALPQMAPWVPTMTIMKLKVSFQFCVAFFKMFLRFIFIILLRRS